MNQSLFNPSQEEGTEFLKEFYVLKSYQRNESMLPPKVEDMASDPKPVSDPKCLKEASFNDSPVDNERSLQNQTFQIDAGKEEAANKAQKRQASHEHEEPALQKLHVNNSRTSDISTASSEKLKTKDTEDSLYLLLNHNESPSTEDIFDSDNVEDTNQESRTGVNEKEIKRSQSCYKFAYPAILVYICNFFRSMLSPEVEEYAWLESQNDEWLRVMLYRTIASCEKELKATSQKFEEAKSELNKNCEEEIQGLALLEITDKKKEMKERKLKNAKSQKIEEERIRSSLEHQFLNNEEFEFCKEDILPILKADRSKFIDNEVQFIDAVKEILNLYKLKEADFIAFKKNHIDDKSLKSMKMWNRAQKDEKKEDGSEETEKEYCEKTGVMMTIIVAMAFKIIPKEEEEKCLTYETRNPSTASLLYFLFTSHCEPQNLLRFRELKFRQHISKEIEKLFKDLVAKINETLLGVGKKKKVETASHTMLNKVLLSINKTRGLHWEKEKKTTKRGGKSSKIS